MNPTAEEPGRNSIDSTLSFQRMNGTTVSDHIPKLLHYCWFGESPLSQNEMQCIESWEKYLPGWKIMRWDDSNIAAIADCRYFKEACHEKKWAFASDYARFAILNEFGGLYFDTDVELLASIDDLVEAGPFMGCENDATGEPWSEILSRAENAGQSEITEGITVNPGLCMCARPGMELYRRVLDSYKDDHFIKPDGTLNMQTVPRRITDLLIQYGLKNQPGTQTVAGITIYPKEYFNPKDFNTGKITMTPNTRAIHHYGMSWLSGRKKLEHRLQTKLIAAGLNLGTSSRIAKVIVTVGTLDFGRVARILSKRAR